MPTTAEAPFQSSRYTTGAIVLHWTIALLIIGQIAGGVLMVDFIEEGSRLQFQVFQLHKSLGISVLVLTVARILWRTFNPPPPEPASVSRLEGWASHVVHMVFYGLMIVIPLSGWILITVSPIQIETKLFFQEWLPWPNLPGLGAVRGEAVEDVVIEVHELLAWLAGILIVLHVAGAVKHHLADRQFINRMTLGGGGDGPRTAFGHATTTVVTLAFATLIIGAAAYGRMEPVPPTDVVSPDQPALLGSAATASAADAAAEAAPEAEPGLAPWAVDEEASEVTFSFGFQGGELAGRIPFTAEIRFDPDALDASTIEATLDLAAATIEPGDVSQNQLRGSDGFAVAQSPTATFRSDAISRTEAGYLATGTLELRGESVPVELPFTLNISEGRGTAEGTLQLDRLAFGIGAENDPDGSWITPLVDVTVRVVAEAP